MNKIKNSICPIIKELERIYDSFSKLKGLDKIAPRPIITIQTKGMSNSLGWHWKDKWQFKKKNISEINICAESLSEDVIETLIHEMVHYHNASLDIEDCNQHQYHNKRFKEMAENYGLNVEKSGRHGWSATSISKALQKIISKVKINKKVFNLYRKKNIVIKSITKMIKYRCDCTIVRCATDLQANCIKCNKPFKQN